MKMKKLLTTFIIILVVLFAGCIKEDYVDVIGVCPLVISTDPVPGAISVPYNKTITATFNEKMDQASISESSFTLLQGTAIVTPMSVSYIDSDSTASFVPKNPLLPFTTYKATIKNTVKDKRGMTLQADYVWTFTTMPMVTLISVPLLGGTTTGGGPYAVGATVTVTATPSVGYVFVNWTENGTQVSPIIKDKSGNSLINNSMSGTEVSTSSSYTFTMPARNRTLMANFIAIVPGNFAINLSSNPPAGGTTSGGGGGPLFIENSIHTVSASPNTGYTFVNWTEGGIIVSTDATYTLAPLKSNRTLVANFLIKTYTLTVNATNGTVAKNPNQSIFNYGSIVVLTPTADTGYTFKDWTGNASGSANPLLVTMDQDKTITANFTINAYTVAVSTNPSTLSHQPTGGGTFNYGTPVTVTAVANDLFTFRDWTENGTQVSTSSSYTFTMPAGNRTLVANYTAITYTVAVSSLPILGGITSGGGTFNSGASVTVTAVANIGYTFTNWTENGTIIPAAPAIYTFTMPARDRTLVANYTPVVVGQFIVALSSNPLLGGTTTGAGSYNSGASVTIGAVPAIGFTFTNWTENGIIVPAAPAIYTFSISGNRTLVANFAPITAEQFLVVLSSNPLLGGNTNGAGSYNSGASVTITAIPNSGFTFTNWTEGVNIISSNANYTFTINENRNFVANFTANVIPPSGPLAIDLGCAAPFAILAGSTITSTGPSIVTGNVGLSPGSALVGFPPATIINGTEQITTPIADAAKLCLTTAFIDGRDRSVNRITLDENLGGERLVPGLYHNETSSGISGTGAQGILTLDAQGNANAVWIFQIASTLTTGTGTSIVLAGDAQAKNIFWIVGSAATLGTYSVFYGNILASSSITLNTGTELNGRALTQIAAVTLDASTVTKPQ